MTSAAVKLAVFLFTVCLIESMNAAATGKRTIRDAEEAKLPEVDEIKARADSGFDVLKFFKELKSKAEIAKIFGGLILKSKGGDSPLKL